MKSDNTAAPRDPPPQQQQQQQAKATKFGLNAREMLLRLAAGEDSDSDSEPQSNPHIPTKNNNSKLQSNGAGPMAAPSTSKSTDVLAAIKRAPAFFSAVDVKFRPRAPFIVRPRMPRVARQRLVDKLFGEHLALESYRLRGLSPEAMADNEVLRKQAVDATMEQEAALYDRCTSAQVYQNLASRTTALEFKPKTNPANALNPNGKESIQGGGKEGICLEGGSIEDIYAGLLADEAKRKKEEEARAQQAAYRQLKRQKYNNNQTTGAGPSSNYRHHDKNLWPANDSKRQQDNKEQGGEEAVSAPALIEADLDWSAPAGPASAGTMRSPSIPPVDTHSHIDNLNPFSSGEQQERAALEAFIDHQVVNLINQGALIEGHRSMVTLKCTSKVVQRHGGQLPEGIVEKEGESIKRLVEKYAQHVMQQD